jgi:hypothetical protein
MKIATPEPNPHAHCTPNERNRALLRYAERAHLGVDDGARTRDLQDHNLAL